MKNITKNDNKSVGDKVFIREEVAKHLKILQVLGLFARKNVL